MTEHKTFIIDDKEYQAHLTPFDQRVPRDYTIYWVDGWLKRIGEVTQMGPRHFRIVGFADWDRVVLEAEDCKSLKEAVTALVLELDRWAARRKETHVSWGEVIVPRVHRSATMHLVYDAGRPESECVGNVTELTSGKWKGKYQATLWYCPVSIRDTASAGVQDIVDIIAQGAFPPHQLGYGVSDMGDNEEEEEERPENAVTCPLQDTPVHFTDCELCGDRGWVLEEDIETYLGPNRVACLYCGGEGWEDGAGPVSWTCSICLGTGEMPVKALEEGPLRGRWIEDQDLHGADLRGVCLDRLRFSACDFSEAKFDGADLTDARFGECQFHGSNPELAASLERAVLAVYGLSEEQLAACVARGATVEAPEGDEDEEDEEDEG